MPELPPTSSTPPRPVPAIPAEAYSREELRHLYRRPSGMLEVVLSQRDRFTQTMMEQKALPWLAILLITVSLAASIPFGVLSPIQSVWKTAAFFCGSLLICFPSLHVFSLFFGFQPNLEQNAVLALLISSVASTFALAFSPIVWFIRISTRPHEHTVMTPEFMAQLFLFAGLLLGVVHMLRHLSRWTLQHRETAPSQTLMFCWIPLLLFISYRMALVLQIL